MAADLIELLSTVEREATLKERERCERIALRHVGAHTYASENAHVYIAQDDWARTIAAAIRKEPNP